MKSLGDYQPLALLRSHDLDETRALVGRIFCEHRLQLPHGSLLNYQHAYLSTGNLSFSQIGYGAEVVIEPEQLGDFYLVQLPLAGRDQQRIHGKSFLSDSRHGSVHMPSQELSMHWDSSCRKLVVRIERQALEQHAAAMLGHSLDKPLAFYQGMSLDHPACQAWREQARYVFTQLQQAPQLFELPLIRSQFEQTLLTTLLTWQPHNYRSAWLDERPRILPKAIKLAVDFIHAHPEQPIDVQALAALSGVSGRSLYAGFEKYLGQSPMRYVREVRLERLHHDLCDPSQPRNVTTLATRWGFYQLGRMALEYRKRYGQCPRETLLAHRA